MIVGFSDGSRSLHARTMTIVKKTSRKAGDRKASKPPREKACQSAALKYGRSDDIDSTVAEFLQTAFPANTT